MLPLTIFVLIFLGAFVAAFLFRPSARRGTENEEPAGTDEAAQAPGKLAESTPAQLAAGPNLSERLHELSSRIEPFAQEAAHPSEIAANADFLIARDLFADPALPVETVMNYALGASFALSYPALAGLAGRPDRQAGRERVLAHFESFPPWGKHFALLYLDALDDRAPLGAPLMQAQDYWAGQQWIVEAFRDSFDRRALAGDTPSFGEDFIAPAPEKCALIRAFLETLPHPSAKVLIGQIEDARRRYIDYAFLNSFGRLWDVRTLTGLAIMPEDWRDAVEQTPELLSRKPARSLVAVGETQTGKTTFLRLVADRLAGDGWQVFEAGGAELMAGQQYFGQLEERIRRVLADVSVEKKLIWYVPDLLQLARSGTHQGQSASILEQITPAIATGAVAIWTEAEPAALARLLQLQPGLRNLFEMARLEPMDTATTLPIAREVAARLANALGVEVDPRCAAAAIEAADHYLSHANLPGSALSLLKLTIRGAGKEFDGEIGPAQVIETLSQLTGLPVSILNASEKLDLAGIRNFFAARVMGQDEAVEAVVERIAMLKAGLSDPGKPVGVFLFAGPTGTGKTELAKTTSEFLFGSPDRMIRLDMSEFQMADSMSKIIGDGTPGETGSLIARVRKQPFSVVLLDEFEKSWPGIWDLFLQVFDDGRLSDPAGHVADFRHCLIILTSNLGATAHRTGGFGFAPPGDTFSNDQVLRAIAQTYRPEFQNRIDRVIVFRPLDRELMRGILRKELDDVLERRGIRDRGWAVEWEPSALEFLLDRGFTPEMGARPLKRAIDRFLLAPLAATIVERRFPEGEQFLFIRSDGRALQPEFVSPDGDASGAGEPVPAQMRDQIRDRDPALTLAAIILSPQGSASEFDLLTSKLDEIEATFGSALIQDVKTQLGEAMQVGGFWDDSARHGVLARYALIDRIKAACGTARHLHERLRGNAGKSGQRPREIVARLALQIHLVEHGLADIVDETPVEVVLAVEPAFNGSTSDRAAALKWSAEILAMYRGWAARRHMQIEEVAAAPGRTGPLLALSGFGAHRILAAECGLHVLEGEDGASRFAARVLIAAGPLGDMPDARRRTIIGKSLEAVAKSSTIIRRYRREPGPQLRNGSGSWRSARVKEALGGDFDLLGAP